MPETPYVKFRLAEHTLADLAALAAGNGGNLSAAVRDAVHYWRVEVERAGQMNAEELDKNEWALLAHTGDPSEFDVDDDPEYQIYARDWAHLLAIELVTMYEGRAMLLASHKADQTAAKKLAKKIADWSIVRGYALYLCLAHFWATPGTGDGEWWHPETWMTPTAKE